MRNLLIGIGLLFSFAVYGEIKEIHQLTEIENILPNNLSTSDWIFFDIDFTLTEPSHPALANAVKQFKKDHKEDYSKLSDEEKLLIQMLVVTQTSNQLTELVIPSLLADLSKKGASLSGLTGAGTFVVPEIEFDLPTWRSKELERLGIHFSSDLPRIEFSQFPSFRGTYPLFADGVLYSNLTSSKGAVLTAFIEKIQQTPSLIVLVDDTLENLSSVEEAMQKKNIPFVGLHYVPKNEKPTVAAEDWNKVWQELRQRLKQSLIPAGILQTSSPTAIEWAIDLSSDESLIIFDIGNVILAPNDAVLQLRDRSWIRAWLENEAAQLDKIALKIIDQEMKMNLVNERIPCIIQKAKTKAKTIALSRYWIGRPSSDKESFEEHRLSSLKDVGIDFEEPFPQASGWYDENLKSTYAQGLLQTEAPLKGPVLLAFLKQINWMPKSIVFVDDRKKQCESISDAAASLGIPTLCIHYTEDEKNVRPFIPEIADLQLRILLKEGRWISDEDAALHMIMHQ